MDRTNPTIPANSATVVIRQPQGSISAYSMLSWLKREVVELSIAVDQCDKTSVLDEVTDVMYCAIMVALSFGISPQQVTSYSVLKGQLRDDVGKDKAMELVVAKKVLAS